MPEREDALAHDQRPRLDRVCPHPPMGLEAPLGAIDTRQLLEQGEVLCQQFERGVAGLVAFSLGQGVVVGQVVVGREQHAPQLIGEGRLARPHRAGDADDDRSGFLQFGSCPFDQSMQDRLGVVPGGVVLFGSRCHAGQYGHGASRVFWTPTPLNTRHARHPCTTMPS